MPGVVKMCKLRRVKLMRAVKDIEEISSFKILIRRETVIDRRMGLKEWNVKIWTELK
jgi:hypothetical protein